MNAKTQKSGLAKAATIFAVVLVASIGLCGANAIAVSAIHGRAQAFLIVTAYTELLGMIVGAVGLLVVAIVGIIRAIFFREAPTRQPK